MFNVQVESFIRKGNIMLAFIARVLGYNDKDMLWQLYQSLSGTAAVILCIGEISLINKEEVQQRITA